ncbi:MAG TPA: SDR family oxidoreductase [Pseudomonadales bacterium]|nr:SDR family oxidoreductase [Pseudomonadales bacterium]
MSSQFRPVALVTGCSTGIGRALMLELASKGYKVYAGVRRLESLHGLNNDHIVPLQLDVNKPDQINQAVSQIKHHEGRLNLLVNNAGYGAMGPLAELPLEQFRAQLETNLVAPLGVIQAFVPLLRKAKPALVVNMGSVSGILATPFSGAYCASKAGLHLLSDALRMELKPFGIDVMVVQPGAIGTDFAANASEQLSFTVKTEGSLYTPVRQAIQARANASQDHPTPAGVFAHKLVAEILAKSPKPVVRIGNGSFLLPALRYLLPASIRDALLRRKFGLHRL